MSKISIIVAATTDMVIGLNNDLPWKLPSDLKYFKKVTDGNFVIMGRKCWESIPEKFRPLPNRQNIVISRDIKYLAKGATVINNLDNILTMFKDDGENDEVFVIGGSQIYKEAFKHADKLYFTEILSDIKGDTYLEGFNISEWMLIETTELFNENNVDFRFKLFEKNE